MKTMLQHTCKINRPPALLRARRFRFHSVLFRFALAVLLLGAAGGGFSLQAQVPTAINFPPGATDEQNVSSYGLFRLYVKVQYQGMMNGVPNPPSGPVYNQYYGYLNGHFTSPLLHDNNTWIGLSAPHCLNFSSDPTLFNAIPGVQCGTWPGATASYSEDLLYSQNGDTPGLPDFPDSGQYNETFTYMINMQLGAYSNCVYAGSSTVPPPYDTIHPMVYTGPQYYPSIHKSIGRMIQSQSLSLCTTTAANYPGGYNDIGITPATAAFSFFDVYMNAYIPPGLGTDVPATGFVLYNDPYDISGPQPLIVENRDVESLPPTLYIHGGTLYAVPVKFLNSGSDVSGHVTWNAGDTFGTLMLSGHELNLVCGSSFEEAEKFINAVLGPPGQANPEPPVLWAFPTNTFPSPGVTYSSQPGTNFGGGSVDQIYFTNTSYGTIYIRSLMHGSLVNPIPPPSAGNSATYTDASSSFSCEVSVDGTNFFGASSSLANPLVLGITNVGTFSKSTAYNTAILSMTNHVNHNTAPNGPFLLRQSFAKSSPGKHVIKQAGAGSYIASYLDATYDLSDDNGLTWYVANRPIRLSIAEPTCGMAGQGVYIQKTNSLEKIYWSGSNYRLQGSTNLSSAFWVNISTNSPVILGATNGFHFFRLVCP